MTPKSAVLGRAARDKREWINGHRTPLENAEKHEKEVGRRWSCWRLVVKDVDGMLGLNSTGADHGASGCQWAPVAVASSGRSEFEWFAYSLTRPDWKAPLSTQRHTGTIT